MPAATAKSRIEVVSRTAVATGAGALSPRAAPRIADPARNRSRAPATAMYEIERLTWDAARTRARLVRRDRESMAPPPRRRSPTPAAATVSTVEPTRMPAAMTVSPPAREVVATEASSAGARPTVRTPRRRARVGMRRDADHDKAGRT